MIQVAAGLVFRDEKILIGRRKGNGPLAGFWEFPGGKIHSGETPEQCLIREFAEELDMKIEPLRFFASTQYQYPHGEIELHAYWCRPLAGPSKFEDHDKVDWVTRENFHHFIFAPADRPLVKMILSSGIPSDLLLPNKF